jgi:dihydrofolate reductase
MRKLIFMTNTTLDGFMAGPNDEHAGFIADDELHDVVTEHLNSADTILFGRVMYQMMEAFWPTAPSSPSLSKGELAFANALNPMPKIVFSRTLQDVGWNTTVLREPEEVNALKSQLGKDLFLSCGPELLATFLQLGLIDEFKLLVHPVVIGRGKALFGDVQSQLNLALLSTRALNSGTLLHHYRAT